MAKKTDPVQTHPSHSGQRDSGRPYAVGAAALDKAALVIPTTPKVTPKAPPHSQALDRKFDHATGDPIARPHGFTEDPNMADKVMAEGRAGALDICPAKK